MPINNNWSSLFFGVRGGSHYPKYHIIRNSTSSEAYLKPSRTSKMELFAKINNGFYQKTQKNSIANIRLGFKYASAASSLSVYRCYSAFSCFRKHDWNCWQWNLLIFCYAENWYKILLTLTRRYCRWFLRAQIFFLK